MKIVMIYGPPSTGKLTVATELTKLTGYTLFHNHEIIDTVPFKFGTKEFFEETIKLKIKHVKDKLKLDSNLIVTFCYFPSENDKFVNGVINHVKKHNGKIMFIQIYSKVSELRKRVGNVSRKKFDKIQSIDHLNEFLRSRDLYAQIPNVESLIIDNTVIPPKKVAQMIKSHYKL